MAHQINFSAHSQDLTSAYNKVLNGGKSWAIFGYTGGASNDLKVVEVGGMSSQPSGTYPVCAEANYISLAWIDGGLDELQEEFDDSKVLYAFARVKDQYSALPKFVLVCWCGSGVPVLKKGLFNTHSSDVQNYFKVRCGTRLPLKRMSQCFVY